MVTVLLIACMALRSSPGGAAALNASIGLYDDGQYAEASAALTHVLQVGLSDLQARTRARLYLASALLALNDRSQASATLDDAVREDPNATADPALFPPELIALFRQAQQRATPTPAATPTAHALSTPSESHPSRHWGLYANAVADPLHEKVGAEAGIAWTPVDRWWSEAGVVIGPRVGGRLLVSRELACWDDVLCLAAAARGVVTPFPAGIAAGGGVGLVGQWQLSPHWALWGQGAAEVYGTPTGALFSPLLTLGALVTL